MKRILVVDDEPRIAAICRDYLERAGFGVTVAASGTDALAAARAQMPDLVVLDLGLPRMDGLDVTRALRTRSNVPIIMLTARVEESDKLIGLELGADDYLTKPFSPRELVARVRAVFRRIDLGPARADILRAGAVTLDVPRMRVTVDDRPVEVTSTEFALLATLMRQPGRVFTRAQLLDAIHGDDGDRLRSRHRRARQEPAPQDRARSARAAAPADGLRRRLPVRRDMRRDGCDPGSRWRGGGGPWVGQRQGAAPGAHVRARFFRRLAIGAIGLVAFGAFGLVATAWLIADRVGAGGWSAAVPVAILLVLGASAAGLLGSLRGGVAPLRAVMDAADRVAGGDYTVRVPEHGPPPVRALARSFNAMTERLEHADRLRRDLMADVAHELRTPLSVLQGRIEGLLDGVYPRDDAQLAALLDETSVLSRLIEDLRTLALADAGALRLEPEPTDLVGLVHAVVRGFEAEASRLLVSMRVTAFRPEIELDLDPLRIRQVLGNLLSNALRHTPAGRAIAVTVADAGDAGVSVAVADQGEGIAAEDVPHVFDRFYKGEASRGSGLGLTIAKRLVTAHGGEISASSRLGQGTTVVFTVPAR